MDRIREFIEEHLNQILIYGAVSIVVLVGLVVALSFGHFSSGADHAAQIAESSSSAKLNQLIRKRQLASQRPNQLLLKAVPARSKCTLTLRGPLRTRAFIR